MQQLSDQELVGEAGRGDNDAVAELFRRHHPAVLRYGRSLARCSTTGEDLAAEAFIKTLKRVRAGTRPATFRAYLLTAARNLYVDQLRRRFEIESLDDDRYAEDLLVTADTATVTVERLDVQAALKALTPSHREVLELAIIDGYSNAEIAEKLGMNPNAAGSLTYRARRALQLAYATS